MQFTSLQAFWPGLQVLLGDVHLAAASHQRFFSLWMKFGLLPERYLLMEQTIHPTERYYPLRPELAESTYALYEATRDPWCAPCPHRLTPVTAGDVEGVQSRSSRG
jgi:mannosidase alpha-like ER degradation enhancer 1